MDSILFAHPVSRKDNNSLGLDLFCNLLSDLLEDWVHGVLRVVLDIGLRGISKVSVYVYKGDLHLHG